jgi:FAD:protein FMN transferase
LKLVGFDKLIIDEKLKTVKFPYKGFKIDFGGITKGWAVDQAREYLGGHISRGIINLGGNIYCFGTPPKGKSFYNVGIKNPRRPKQLAATVKLLDQSVATSGNYEQFIMIDGTRYTHLIDPRTGMPVHGVDSVSVVCQSAAMSDILSTAIFVGGDSVKEKLRQSSKDLSYLWIDIREVGEHVIEKFGAVFEAIDPVL